MTVRASVTPANEVILLRPDDGSDPSMPAESMYPGQGGGQPSIWLRNVSQASITVFPAEPAATAQANGVGVIVAPGGGWRILAWEHEGISLAQWLAARGYTAFLLKYRLLATPADDAVFAARNASLQPDMSTRRYAELPREIAELLPGERERAARLRAEEDGRAALALVRARALSFGIEPTRVGMIGFSAGAFVTSAVAMDAGTGAAPLAFAAAIYGGETLGRPVPADAPPLFTVVASDDRLLLRTVEALHRDWMEADRPAEMHVFTRGGHGFGLTPQNKPVDRWLELFGSWLVDQGFG